MLYHKKIYCILFISILFSPLAHADNGKKSFILFEQKMHDASSCQKQLKNFLRTSAQAFDVEAVKVSKENETRNNRLFRIYPSEKEVMHFSCDNKLLKVWYDFE